jgi:hypothetical protein
MGGWQELDWDEAIAFAAEHLVRIQKREGNAAVGVYVGNPTIHSYSALVSGLPLLKVLKTRTYYTSNSVDALPRALTSFLLYGSQAVIPVPDLDRTDFLLVLGANPAVSNGSVMMAPDCAGRIKGIRKRGGTVVGVDPRRTETARMADGHHFIRPGPAPHGIHLGPLVPRMPQLLVHRRRRLPLTPNPLVADLERLRMHFQGTARSHKGAAPHWSAPASEQAFVDAQRTTNGEGAAVHPHGASRGWSAVSAARSQA